MLQVYCFKVLPENNVLGRLGPAIGNQHLCMVISPIAKTSPLEKVHFVVAAEATAAAVWGSITLTGLHSKPVNSLTHKHSSW